MVTIKALGVRIPQIIETGFLANLVAGAIIGFLARLAMAGLTLSGGLSNEFSPLAFTLPGTIRIMTFPMLFGLPIAFLFVWGWQRLPSSGWGKAGWAGLIICVFPGLILLTDSSFKLNGANRYLGLPLFGLLNFGYGFLLGLTIQHLYHRATMLTGFRRWVRWGLLIGILAALVWLYQWSDAIAFNR